jgi:plastocyanin
MKRLMIAVVLVSALAVFWLAGFGRAMTVPKLVGTSGPGFSIEVTKGGKDVKKLTHGTYKIVVHDKSTAHNFHLFGPGLSKKTTVPFVGTQTWTVKLKKGKYTYQCDIHFAVGMKGSFRVT